MRPPRLLALATVILLAAASRLLPHPPNFAPIAAMALFGGAYLRERWQALAVPLGAMAVSDVILGGHALLPLVYGCFALTVGIGMFLRSRKTVAYIAGAALSSSLLFFIVTNFGVWAVGSLYPKTLAGLGAAYVAALPFFRNTIAGDLFYTAILFGGFGILERLIPDLREPGRRPVTQPQQV